MQSKFFIIFLDDLPVTVTQLNIAWQSRKLFYLIIVFSDYSGSSSHFSR